MPSVAGKHVLLIGDSLSASSAAPGGVLARELRAAGASVVDINAKVGRSAYSFLMKEGGEAQLKALTYKPDLAIVMLGTNDTGYTPILTQQSMANLKTMLELSGAKVYAIGPPLFASTASTAAGRDGVMQAMRSVFGGNFIDAGPATADLVGISRTADQIHFTPTGGEIAGVRLAKAFMSKSSMSSIVVGAAVVLAVVLIATRR